MKKIKSAIVTGLLLGMVLVVSFLFSVFIVGISYKYITPSPKEQVKDTWDLEEHSMIINDCPFLKEQLKKVGVLGEHSLLLQGGDQGVLSKRYFLNISSGTEGITDFGEIQFRWIPGHGEGKIVATTLQSLQIRFFVDETKKTPTVEFVFDKDWLNKVCNDKDVSKNSHFKNSYLNANRYAMSDVMLFAKIRMSSKEIERQAYFIMSYHAQFN